MNQSIVMAGLFMLRLDLDSKCSLSTKVTYLLALVEEAWESAGKVELKKRRAWLANLASTWAAILYGQEHEEARLWEARCSQVKEREGGCEMEGMGREVATRREGWRKTGGRKKNNARLKRQR